MRNDTVRRQHVCRNCGCNESDAIADARTLGFQQELETRLYTCCQIVGWADEQWQAWMEAAVQALGFCNQLVSAAPVPERFYLEWPVRQPSPTSTAAIPFDSTSALIANAPTSAVLLPST
jgi:hypothetical protein